MIERQFQTKQDIELLELWMSAPPWDKPTLPFDGEEYLRDLQFAYKLLLDHGGSARRVWPMLIAHHKAQGRTYSEATARRRVEEAKRVFLTINSHTTRFTAELMLNSCQEEADSAKRAGKFTEFARLSKEVREWVHVIDNYIREDAERITQPIAIEQVFDPALAGITPDPNIREKVAEYLRKRQEQRGLPPIADAEFTEDAT